MQTTEKIEQKYAGQSEICSGSLSRPLFVVGVWRSGTSLLYSLLNQHSEIALMYEGELVVLKTLFWKPRNKWDWLTKWEFWNAALTRHHLDTNLIPSGAYDLKTAVKTAYIGYARQTKGANIWGCKSPNYYNSLPPLARLFPDARFIIIWRDLRGICDSILRAAKTSWFFRRKGMILRAILGYRKLKLDCDRLIAQGVDVYQLQYEDLVKAPDRAMAGVCAFLQVPFEPKVTSLLDADRSAIENARHHELVKGNQILASSEVADILPVPLRNKIESYIALWRKQSNNEWPVYPKSLSEAPRKLSLWVRAGDQLSFAAFRAWDLARTAVYPFCPSWIWGKYRNQKYRRQPLSRPKYES